MDEIKPIGFLHKNSLSDLSAERMHGDMSCIPLWTRGEYDINVPVYDQSAIDALKAEVARAESRIKHLESANIAYSEQLAMAIGRAGCAEEEVKSLRKDARLLDFMEQHGMYLALDAKRFKRINYGTDRSSIEDAMKEQG